MHLIKIHPIVVENRRGMAVGVVDYPNFEVEHSTFLCSSVALVKPAQLHVQVKAMNVFVRCIE